jgi:hypothetical protein
MVSTRLVGTGAAVAAVLFGTSSALAQTYYIDPAGNDSNSGTSEAEAWKTLANLGSARGDVYFKAGGQWETSSGLRVSGVTYACYGDGAPPLIRVTGSGGFGASPVSVSGDAVVDGLHIQGVGGTGITISGSNNLVQNCEIDGQNDPAGLQMGIGVMGENNRIIGNYVHDIAGMTGDSGDMNTSGGAEGIMVMASNNEIAYNSVVNCWGENQTLGGAEGGCMEIVNGAAGATISGVSFHHNYCERSVGLFEACAGNFSGDGQNIMLNHAKVRNSTVSYNVSIDAMWLYLLQPTNTDFENLVFEHNTLIHGPANTDIPQRGASSFGLAYETDPVWTADKKSHVPCETNADCTGEKEQCLDSGGERICVYQFKLQPGTVLVRNNLLVVLPDADAAMMVLPPGPDDVINNVFVPKAPMGIKAGSGVIVLADVGLVDTYKLSPTSPAVDAASPDLFQPWVDYEGNKVPCGSAPDRAQHRAVGIGGRRQTAVVG